MAKKRAPKPTKKKVRKKRAGANPLGKPSTLTKLTPEEYGQLLTYIRAGAFDYIAAEAVGLSHRTFLLYMEKGRLGVREEGGPNYPQFYHDVTKAKSQARMLCESRVAKDNPLAWLRYGGGKQKRVVDSEGELEREGWTEDCTRVIHEGIPQPAADQHLHLHVLGPNPSERLDALAGVFKVFEDSGLDPKVIGQEGQTLDEALGDDEEEEQAGIPYSSPEKNGHSNGQP